MSQSEPNSPTHGEQTHLSWGLVGFNVSWVLAGLSAAVAACGFLWFDSIAALVVGTVLAVVSLLLCIRFLRMARKE